MLGVFRPSWRITTPRTGARRHCSAHEKPVIGRVAGGGVDLGAPLPLPLPLPLFPGARSSRPASPGRRASRIGALLGATALAVLVPASSAHADPPAQPAQHAGGYERRSPRHTTTTGDGCYATPAIGPDGTLAPGLNTSGAINGSCRDQSDLDNSQTYARSKCNNGWCAIVYASYFEKDQAVERQRPRRPPARLGAHHLLGGPGGEPCRVRVDDAAQRRQDLPAFAGPLRRLAPQGRLPQGRC